MEQYREKESKSVMKLVQFNSQGQEHKVKVTLSFVSFYVQYYKINPYDLYNIPEDKEQ
jgi:hypothetical protein